MDFKTDSTANGHTWGCGHRDTGSTAVTHRVEGGRETECSGSHGPCGGGCGIGWQSCGPMPQAEPIRLACDLQAERPEDSSRDDNGILQYAGGGKRGRVEERFDLIPPHALRAAAKAMAKGAERYGELNWHGLPISNMLNHAIRHVFLFLAGDREEDHLAHAACNLLMARDQEERL